jgi:hypothetical protein
VPLAPFSLRGLAGSATMGAPNHAPKSFLRRADGLGSLQTVQPDALTEGVVAWSSK